MNVHLVEYKLRGHHLLAIVSKNDKLIDLETSKKLKKEGVASVVIYQILG
jgi:hypothetical protein